MRYLAEMIMFFVCLAVISIFIWAQAYFTVATECEKLGAFYVGQKVYECKLKGMP